MLDRILQYLMIAVVIGACYELCTDNKGKATLEADEKIVELNAQYIRDLKNKGSFLVTSSKGTSRVVEAKEVGCNVSKFKVVKHSSDIYDPIDSFIRYYYDRKYALNIPFYTVDFYSEKNAIKVLNMWIDYVKNRKECSPLGGRRSLLYDLMF